MADAEDLKSSGDFSSCGFDSHPGHHQITPVLMRVFERLFLHLPIRALEMRVRGLFMQLWHLGAPLLY
jgi:hypothetical protein